MSSVTPTNNYAAGVGLSSTSPFVEIFLPRSPTTNDISGAYGQYKIQQRWWDTLTNDEWVLVGFTSFNGQVTANWQTSSSGLSDLNTLTVDTATGSGSNPVTPTGNTITITGGQIGAGTTANVIRTDTTVPHQFTIEVQRSQAVATSTIGDNGVCHFDSADFTVDSNGFVSIAESMEGVLSVQVDASTGPGTDPVLPNASGVLIVTGAQVAAGTISNVIQTNSLAANTYTIQIQRSQAVASTTIGDNGVCHFDSSSFGVDANGFVTLKGGSEAVDSIQVDAATGPGTNPVVPSTAGLVIVTGGQVAAGTTTNVIQTNSLAANTYTVQIQRSQAVASTTIGDNGVCHFSSNQFAVDANGFVTLSGGGQAIDSIAVQAGTSPIVPTSGGLVTINGATVAAGSTPVGTNGTGANTMAVQVQISQAIASTDATKIGLAAFNSTQFSCDANGFVGLAGSSGGKSIKQVAMQTFTSSGTYTPTSGMSYCTIKVLGGGAGAGGVLGLLATNQPAGAGGGGPGGNCTAVFSAASIGASQTVTIGAGGAGGIGSGAAGAGGTTSVGSLIQATGGVAGGQAGAAVSIACGNPGASGVGSSAASGAVQATSPCAGRGLGGAIATNFSISGFGGSTEYGSGGTSVSYESGSVTNGNPGTGYGSGGSGAVIDGTGSDGSGTGGAGAPGIVIITEYIA